MLKFLDIDPEAWCKFSTLGFVVSALSSLVLGYIFDYSFKFYFFTFLSIAICYLVTLLVMFVVNSHQN